VLALQRRVGNTGVQRILARTPDPKAPPPPKKQWESPELVKEIYPGREAMLRRFVAMYREIEAQSMKDPDAQKKAMGGVKAADQLSGDALLKEVNRLFDAGVAPEWMKEGVIQAAGMRYSGAHNSYFNPVKLLYIVKRMEGTWTKARAEQDAKALKDYEREKVSWEAADADYKTKHKAWADARKGGAKDPEPVKPTAKRPVKPKPVSTSELEKVWLGKSEEEAEQRLLQMHDQLHEIPEWAWHKIVRVTGLRITQTTGKPDWEDLSKEAPDPTDVFWVSAMKEWTAEATTWRQEMNRRNEAVSSRMVCNEYSELLSRKRGIELKGGINLNAQQFVRAGAYFKHPATLGDFREGANLFWIQNHWETKEPDNSNKVVYVPGNDYPMPPPPEYVEDWKKWAASDKGKQYKKDSDAYKRASAAWERLPKKEKERRTDNWTKLSDDEKAKVKDADKPLDALSPPEKTEPTYDYPKLLPPDGEAADGWTYTVKPGQPITRSKGEGKDKVTHWMRWEHEATVLHAMPDTRIFIAETTFTPVGKDQVGVAGYTTRWLKDLVDEHVFIGYIPRAGEVIVPPQLQIKPAPSPSSSSPSAP
jgi:hypothetical protein